MIDGLTGSHNGDIGTVQYLDGLAYFEVEVVVLINIGHGGTAYTDVAGFIEINQEFHQFLRETPVGGQTNGHAWEGAQRCNVVQRVVGSTQCAVCYTT